MKNFVQNGDMISVTAPAGGIASRQGIVVGSLFCVAAKAAAEGESVEIATVGVYELPKAPATVIAQGARVAWDETAKQVVPPGAGLYPIGVAVLAAGNGATVARVRLDGVATQAI